MTLRPENLIALGRITRTQGHLGALRLLPYFSPPDQFELLQGNELILVPAEMLTSSPGTFRGFKQEALRILHVSEHSYHQEYIIVRFEEIPDMTAAEHVRNMEVYVRTEHLWPLPEDQYYPHELIGFEVLDTREKSPLGVVADLRTGGAQDYLVVRGGKKEFLIPLVGEMVEKISREDRQIHVHLPPGLEDL